MHCLSPLERAGVYLSAPPPARTSALIRSNVVLRRAKQESAQLQIAPTVNQIEFHPYCLPTYLPTLLPLCLQHNIVLSCYAPLLSLVRHTGGPVDSVVQQIAQERGRNETEGQILLQWARQVSQGIVVT